MMLEPGIYLDHYEDMAIRDPDGTWSVYFEFLKDKWLDNQPYDDWAKKNNWQLIETFA